MKTKNGISLVVLIITIIVMVIITGIVIAGVEDVLKEAKKDDFVVELATIKDKAKEYYLLMGSLPVRSGIEYTANEVKAKLTNSAEQSLLYNEINENNDVNNTFYIVDIELLQLETSERGKEAVETDIFLIASNTLNTYYLKGVEIENVLRFSLVDLVSQNIIEDNTTLTDTKVTLDTSLNLIKSTNVWTNEIKITVKNNLQDGETLQYSVAGATEKTVPDNKVIAINSSNMTSVEQEAFVSNKIVSVSKLVSGTVTETKEISVDNLDITNPSLGTMEMIDTTDENYNTIKINCTDKGESGVKAVYYDYNSMLVSGTETAYYSDRSNVSTSDLINYGKASKDGTIKLAKNIKTIVAIGVDNAGNISGIGTYTIENTYLKSE